MVWAMELDGVEWVELGVSGMERAWFGNGTAVFGWVGMGCDRMGSGGMAQRGL